MQIKRVLAGVLLMSGFVAPHAFAWDYLGHRTINQVALASLPADFPSFVKASATSERIAFLAGEPDRWRNTPDLPLKHCASPDHFIDYEQIKMAGLDPATVPQFRYDFVVQFAAGRASHALAFPPLDPETNVDHTAGWPGFAPWAITEQYAKLKSGFSYLKVYKELGTPEEIANAEANIIYVMGVMGHFVGDCSQPLHLTMHHNGWVGDNPKGYTRWPGFHAWIDGGFIGKVGIKAADLMAQVKPVEPIALTDTTAGRDPMFNAVMAYVAAQHEFVEPIYALEKARGFKTDGSGTPDEGKKFIEARLLTGGTMLARIWATAWKEAGPDTYLRVQLEKRKKAAGGKSAPAGQEAPAAP